MKRKSIKNDKIAEIYEKKLANISATAAALGISRMTLVRWREQDSTLDQMMKDVEESMLDFTEGKLYERINDGDTTAIIFLLKTKGKNRGYVEKTQQEVKVEAPIRFTIKEAKDFLDNLEKDI